MSKLVGLAEAAAMIPDGAVVAMGGNVMHRSPAALARALARRGARGLHFVKTAAAYDADLLCACGCLASVSAGYVGYESEFGLAPHYRKAVESGSVEAREHACYTIITALRAAIQGVSFLPVKGLEGSDLPAARGWKTVSDPYTGAVFVAIPAIRPDWAVIHVQEADRLGNGRILGPRYEDVLLAKASRNVILTAERVVDRLDCAIEAVDISGFMVSAVVAAPGGARPCSCAGRYGIDVPGTRSLVESPVGSAADAHLSLYARNDGGAL